MMSTSELRASRAMNLIARIEEPPIDGVYRALLGFALPAAAAIAGWPRTLPALAASFAALLLALRVGPAVLRKLVPFPYELRTQWETKRQLAKRFDSYQWRKLFWFGLGLAAHSLATRRVEQASATLGAFCLVTGIAGLAIWRYRSGRLRVRAAAAAPSAAADATANRRLPVLQTGGK